MINTLDVRRLKFAEETRVNCAMTRLDGRAPTGARVIGTVPQHDGDHITMLGTLGLPGLQAVMTVDGATDAELFRPDLTQVLGPTLAPGDIVVLDHQKAPIMSILTPALDIGSHIRR